VHASNVFRNLGVSGPVHAVAVAEHAGLLRSGQG
jgi:hypothetical protein